MISERAIGRSLPVRLEELVKADSRGFLERPVLGCEVPPERIEKRADTVAGPKRSHHPDYLCISSFFIVSFISPLPTLTETTWISSSPRRHGP
jgi:hypothetical protein